VRDRLGIKPLYHAPTAHGVLFGSEPKAILAHPAFDGVVNLDGFREMLAIVKTPEQSVYSGMYEVRPGQVVTVGRPGPGGPGAVRSFAVDFTGYTENFVADVVRPTPDTPFAHDLARHVGADHRDIVLSTADLMDPDVLRDVVGAFDHPVNWGDGYTIPGCGPCLISTNTAGRPTPTPCSRCPTFRKGRSSRARSARCGSSATST
jgi:asparagine synthetase B (glutamine-hydrolysing)